MAGAVYLVLCIFFGLATGNIARIKGSSFWMWFLIGAVFPLLGMIAALLYRYETNELRRPCPGCGRVVMLYDAICTRCSTELDFPDTAIEPRAATLEHR
jgi:hypothetical protein